MTIEWMWRQRERPAKCLVVVGRSQFDMRTWVEVRHLLEPSVMRLLGDPRILGVGASLDYDDRLLWTVSAWPDYDSLEACMMSQREWLTETAKQVEAGTLRRHSIYRMVDTADLPLSWTRAKHMMDDVLRASPLGADAFPEITERLGLDRAEKMRGERNA